MEDIKKRYENYITKIPYYDKIKENLVGIIIYLLLASFYIFMIFIYPLSILAIFLFPVIILHPKIESFIERNLNFKDFEQKIDDKTLVKKEDVSNLFKSILQNITYWLEFYELKMNLFIRFKRRRRSILMKILLYISILIYSILIITFTHLNLHGYWQIILQIFNYIVVIPLFSLDIKVNKPKISYRCFKKTLKYIHQRLYLIFQSQKIRESMDDIQQIEKALHGLNKRIDAFNKIFKPTSTYLREFEVISIIGLFIGIFLNTYVMSSINFYILSLLLLSSIMFVIMIYIFYLLLHHKINFVIIKSEIYRKIEYYLDSLTFFHKLK